MKARDSGPRCFLDPKCRAKQLAIRLIPSQLPQPKGDRGCRRGAIPLEPVGDLGLQYVDAVQFAYLDESSIDRSRCITALIVPADQAASLDSTTEDTRLRRGGGEPAADAARGEFSLLHGELKGRSEERRRRLRA
jgi:hypothetical protein